MSDMNNILTKLFMVIMLMMFSMGAQADVKVLYGEKGTELQPDKDGTITLPQKEVTGGTIIITQEDKKDGTTIVTFKVTPDNGYTMAEEGPEVLATVPTNIKSGSTRGVTASTKLDLKSDDFKDISEKRTYTTTIDSKLALWVKSAKFQERSRDTKSIYPDDVYYIKNSNSGGWYLWPAIKVTKSGDAFQYEYKYLTTHDGTTAVAVNQNDVIYPEHDKTYCHWVVKNVDGKIQLINPKLNKYVIIRKQTYNTGADVWLADLPEGDDIDYSYFVLNASGNRYKISPFPSKYVQSGKTTANYSFNSKNGNTDRTWLTWSSAGENYPHLNEGVNGVIQFYNGGTPTWSFEKDLLDAPTISDVDEEANTFTITDANSLAEGYTIRYTVGDGTQDAPTATTGTEYFGPVLVDDDWTVKAVVVRYGVVLTNVGSKTLSPVSTKPIIRFDNSTNQVSISCRLSTATIFYNTGDGSQSNPTSSSTPYNNTPFSVTTPTTVKAIAVYPGDVVSEVATLAITQVATPIIQDNGSNAISITTTTPDATIYYTTDGSDPTTSSTEYTEPLTENVSNVTIKAIAVKENMITSDVGSGTVKLQCATPVITREGMTFTLSCSMPADASFYYSLDNNPPSTPYNGPVTFTLGQLPMTVTAVAKHNDYTDSESATFELKTGEGTSEDPYLIYSDTDFANFINDVNEGRTSSACYKLEIDVSGSGVGAITTAFSGTFDGGLHTISDLGHALFNTINAGIVKNVMLDNVAISGGTNVGAICNEATGASRIYNCGVLATGSTVEKDEDGYTTITSCSSTISGSGYVGGIVGLLDGSSRVINCFSYANVSGGTHVGGIVGYNNVATTSSNPMTMVMNCMFYGDITGGGSKAPIYNGESIVNKDATGVSNFNYFLLEAPYMEDRSTTKTYNCALAAEKRYLQRFEFFRHLLNSHRELAGWWATGTYSSSEMAKWVLEPSQIGTSTCYPILKTAGYYPSVVNIDAENAQTSSERNTGGKLGTLSVTIQKGTGGAVFGPPADADITTSSLTLNITDKDPDHFNFNYYKVQLPYYNDVGTKNYTSNRVVTGWKIVDITGGTTGSYTTGEDATADTNGNITATPYNFADRQCTNKDLYSVSGRVFNQGAYWDVPEGVTGITIQPYWGKAVYLADAYADVVYNQDMTAASNVPNVGGGQKYTNGGENQFNGQKVYTALTGEGNAIASSVLGANSAHTVYDYAVVLVGNFHYNSNVSGNLEGGNKPYTVTSVDLDGDNEPDYSFILRFDSRMGIHPVRYDFLNLVGLGMAQKSTGGTGTYNLGIMQPKYWFEVTNTALFRVTQFEYDNNNRVEAPYILQGGVIEQWVSGQNNGASNKTTYFHVGGNVWFNEFHRGSHQDKQLQAKHPPISVTGGDYDQFYLTGFYKAVTTYNDDAECYINGGRFGIVAGTGMEGIGDAVNLTKGNIIWQIQNADIDEFYGGGINAASPMQGNITTVITGGYIKQFCGGPKFGDMQSGRTVKTTATDCTFDTYFGAGYGGNSYSRQAPYNYNNQINIDWNKWVKGEIKAHTDNKYNGYWQEYKKVTDTTYEGGTFEGVSTQIAYQFMPMSGNADNCARLWIEYVKFSLATTYNVTSKLTGCTITGNFYGGGNLGKVDGPVNSTLINCNVEGNAFGAGFSATLPKVKVMKTGGFSKEPKYDENLGVYLDPEFPDVVEYTWAHKDVVNSTATAIDKEKWILYTTEDLNTLGTVTGTATLNIDGSTTVAGSVYGGGEQSGVDGNTVVTINNGTIGTSGLGGATYGNVYGGGKGKAKNEGTEDFDDLTLVKMGLVKGSTNVTINGGDILHNVYGGGAFGSVGNFTFADAAYNTANPTATLPLGTIVGYTGGGTANVTITGGTIGTTGKDNGMVFGSSRGDVDAPGSIQDRLAWVHDTHVIIGTSGQGTTLSTPLIKGSVYGSGENGHTYQNTIVDVYGGTIGITEGATITTNNNGTPDDDSDDTKYSGAEYPYRGNVYGGGCGTDTYTEGDVEKFNPLAGIVQGNATVNIDGGQVVHNVYGAGAMGSVGNATDATSGKTTVNIKGGRIGFDGERNGNVFGAARGEYGISTAASNLANVRESEVNICYTTTTPAADNEGKTEQLIAGSVFGGGESGVVKGSVTVKMTGGLLLKDIYGGGALADTQTSNWDATNNTWAAGKTSASTTTTIRLTGGTILGEAYGGGLGEAGKPAYVYGNVLLDLNGTTSSGEEGTPIANDARGCAVGEVFGCNNAAGTPMGQVMVHIYATQNKTKSQIANTAGETPVTDAKVKGSYDVKAVYGGGNLAAYEPAGGKNTTNSTNVIIDGCGLTSIQQVYGGGNAASTPATNVTVNGTFEIEEVFGGGNGKDDLPNGDPNPGANVGFRAYDVDATNAQTPEDRASNYGYGTGKASVNIFGGTIHRVFGGSNTKGNVRQTAVTILQDVDGCDFHVDEAYGGGKSAPMDAEAKLLMACIPGLKAAYGGAQDADIQDNVVLTITNGTFDRVFGGNNVSGNIHGTITINIEETGCKPVVIGQLYGGGNQAPYTAPTGEHGPTLNIKSFTSIGEVFGGGYGETAVVKGDTYVNIDVRKGKYALTAFTEEPEKEIKFSEYRRNPDGSFQLDADDNKIVDEKTIHVLLPGHAANKIGAINNVFGGGNSAKVDGNTNVNIGTEAGEEVYTEVAVTKGASVVGYYTRNENSYVEASGTAVDGTTYYQKTVKGADIRGNVYGGGNNAGVTGNTNVVIGKEAVATPTPEP